MEKLSLFTLSSKELRKKSGIYKLSAGGHIYVGSSKNLYDRLMEHRHDLLYHEHSNDFLQKVSDKYGVQNIEVEILEFCDPSIRIDREREWIKKCSADMNLQDPVTRTLSKESREKLSKSVRKGLAEGKYKTKFDFEEIECYDYFGNLIRVFKNKEVAAKILNVSKSEVQRIAGGYRKGIHYMGIRLRYKSSAVPKLDFPIRPHEVGRYFNFYYIDENGSEKPAFHSVKDCWSFFSKITDFKPITIIPKLKWNSVNLGKSLLEDNHNPSVAEM